MPQYRSPDPAVEERYLAHPNRCPYCNKEDINVYERYDDGNEVECLICGKTWIEIVKIVGLMEEEE